MTPIDSAHSELVAAAHSLFARGYSFGTAGNMSVRTGAAVLSTPTGSSLGSPERAGAPAAGAQIGESRRSRLPSCTPQWPAATRRIVGYGMLAQSAGAHAVVKIDEHMADEAAARGSRISVVATVMTTLEPTERLIHREARAGSRQVVTHRYLAEGAFDALMTGDAAAHDSLVTAAIARAAAENDVVVLAQGSMARLVKSVEPRIRVPLLSSPRLGVEALRDALASTRSIAAANGESRAHA